MRAAQGGRGARNRSIVRGKKKKKIYVRSRLMDGAELTCAPASTTVLPAAAGHQLHISRPTLGFPLGTALLLIIIFCLSGIFSCCYHWEKLRSLLRRGRRHNHHHRPSLPTAATATAQYHQDSSLPFSPSKLTFKQQDSKLEMQLSLPVIMAGDRFPKFMALPCPSPLPITATATAIATNNNATNDAAAAAAATVITVDVLVFPSPSPSLSAPSH